MAFFDKLGKSVTEVSQKTIARTKELADTSKLHSMIAEQERIITTQYAQIGKLYAAIHKNDCEYAFAAMIAAIADAEAKISDYNKQIQEIRGIRRCESCGAEIPADAAFCSSCGSAMPETEAPVPDDSIKCKNCGAVIKDGNRFCTECGTPIQ